MVKIIKSDEIPSIKGLTESAEIFPVITKWQRYCNLAWNNDVFIHAYDEVEETKLYERFGYDSTDEFMQEKILVNYDLVASQIKEIWKRIKVGDLVNFPPLKKPGNSTGNNQFKRKGNNITFPEDRGTNKAYITRRLKRDAPELAEKVIKGELSAHRASIKAGWGKPMITHPATLEGFEKAIRKKLNAKEIKQLKDVL